MVSIICCTIRQGFMENVFRNYETQSWKKKELIVLLNRDDMDKDKWEARARLSRGVSVHHLSEALTLGECLNFGIEKAKYNYIAKFDDDDYYAPRYLLNAMRVLQTTKADLVGKKAVYMYFQDKSLLAIHRQGEENKYVTQGLKGATLLFKKAIYSKVRFPPLDRGEDLHFIERCICNNYLVYAADKSDYVCLRFSAPGHHTWNIRNDKLIRQCAIVCNTDDFKSLIEADVNQEV